MIVNKLREYRWYLIVVIEVDLVIDFLIER